MERQHLGAILFTIGAVLVIILALVKVQTDAQGSFLCELVEEDPNMAMDECPAHESPISWFIMIAFGLAIAVSGAGAYFYLIPGSTLSSPAKETKKVDSSKLDKEEKKIYDLLKENDNSMYQSDLIKETEFSKVKISRLLDKMQAKGIIDRKRRGMTNIVVLK